MLDTEQRVFSFYGLDSLYQSRADEKNQILGCRENQILQVMHVRRDIFVYLYSIF